MKEYDGLIQFCIWEKGWDFLSISILNEEYILVLSKERKTNMPVFSPIFRLNHDLYIVPDPIQNSSLQKSKPSQLKFPTRLLGCVLSQQSEILLDYDWYKRVIRLPSVHTAPSLELLAQTPSNFNLWYWFTDANRQYCCSNAFRAVPNCEAHYTGTSCFIQRSHHELGIQSFTKIVESNGLFEKRRTQILFIIIWKFVLQTVLNDYDREKWPIIKEHARMQTTFCFSVKLNKW